MYFTKRTFILVALLLSPLISDAQEAEAQRNASQKADVIMAANVLSIDLPANETLEKRWRIFIRKPDSLPPLGGYAVLYLLDGNANFPIAWRVAEDSCKTCSVRNVLIVGIGYPTRVRVDTQRRMRDFLSFSEESMEKNGFNEFINDTLPRALKEKFKINNKKSTLFGHSFGGLFALNTLIKQSESFSNYVVADPSYWWNDGTFLEEQKNFLATQGILKNPSKLRILFEQSSEMRTKNKKYRGIDSLEKIPENLVRLSTFANAKEFSKLKNSTVLYRHFSDETHSAMVDSAIEDALIFATGASPASTKKINFFNGTAFLNSLLGANQNENNSCKVPFDSIRERILNGNGACPIPRNQ
jgi:predicted alpha/beta superfamily hydrolase